MKANEAPEKLYFGEYDKTGLIAYSKKESEDEIEYTRTDTFIEKTEEFLYEKLNSGDMECGDIATFINDFKKAMRV